jgi:ABC-type dipeptide/oligopeptide/nickel transport system permease component
MPRYLLGRIIATIPVVVLITVLVFLLIHAAPGDPADLLLSEEASAADIAEARHPSISRSTSSTHAFWPTSPPATWAYPSDTPIR